MSDFCGGPISVKARKAHRCDWCGEKINKGDSYTKMFFLCDGEAWTAKLHAECDEARQSYDYDGEPLCFVGQFQRGHNHEPGEIGETAEKSLYRCPGCVAELKKTNRATGSGGEKISGKIDSLEKQKAKE